MVAVIPHKNYGQSGKVGGVNGHTSSALDIQFHPFNDSILATCAADASIKIWNLDEEAISQGEISSDAVQSLEEHEKKVTRMLFHPTANNVLASTSIDKTIRLWDIESGKVGAQVSIPNPVQDMAFNINGQQMAVTSRDKKLRIVDPRLGENAIVVEVDGHTGSKPCRTVWLQKLDLILTAGFSRSAERTLRLWDPRNMEGGSVFEMSVDQQSGILMPFFDEDTSTLLVAGKGDGNIRQYEIRDREIYSIGPNGQYASSTPQKGMTALPKLALDIDHHEVSRVYKLTRDSVIPVSFKVPRKSEAFQSDIFPDTFASQPTNDAAGYFEGKDTEPNTCSLKPGERPEVDSVQVDFKPVYVKKEKPTPTKAKSSEELQKENEELKNRVAQLEKENAELKAKLEEQSEAEQPETEQSETEQPEA